MEFVITVIGGMILLAIILSLGDSSNKFLDKATKGKNVSMPDFGLLFGRKRRK